MEREYMDLVAGIIGQARYDVLGKDRYSRKGVLLVDECPITPIHPAKDCALPLMLEATDIAYKSGNDALEIALHIMEYIQHGI